jgi:copper(I)-binding protein
VKRRLLETVAAVAVLMPLAAEAAKITIAEPWVRALPGNAAGYFTLTNDSDKTIVLVGARSSACGMVMLHKTSREGGMASMSGMTEVRLAPHETVKFAPGGLHLMCMDQTAAMKPGKTVTMTLEFADKSQNPVSFAVKNAAGH